MTNKKATELANRFLETQDSQVFEELWSSTVNMVQPYKYFDPTGARTAEDFLQVTRIGLYEALQSFEVDRGSTLLTWIRMRMTQLLIREVRRINRNSLGTKISLDQNVHLEGSEGHVTVEQMIYEELVGSELYQNACQEWSDDLYWRIIVAVSEKVSYNIPLAECFQLKLAFPNISRNTIAKILCISKPTISQYFSTIRRCISLAVERYEIRN